MLSQLKQLKSGLLLNCVLSFLQVEFVYPAFTTENLEKGLPVPWNPLLHLALPDGAHNFDEGIFVNFGLFNVYKGVMFTLNGVFSTQFAEYCSFH